MAIKQWQTYSKEAGQGNYLDGAATQISTVAALHYTDNIGFDFSGWTGQAYNDHGLPISAWTPTKLLTDGAVIYQTDISNSESVMLTAYWTPHTYTINYVDYVKEAQTGVSVHMPDEDMLCTEYTVNSPAYTFNVHDPDDTFLSGGYEVYWSPTSINPGQTGDHSNKTISAVWTLRTHNIHYNTNGGTIIRSTRLPESYTIEDYDHPYDLNGIKTNGDVIYTGHELTSITPMIFGIKTDKYVAPLTVDFGWKTLGYRLEGFADYNISGGFMQISTENAISIVTHRNPAVFETITYGDKICISVDPGLRSEGMPRTGYDIDTINIYDMEGQPLCDDWQTPYKEITMPACAAVLCVYWRDREGIIHFDPGY